MPTTRLCCSPPIATSPRPSTRGEAITPAAEWLIDNFHVVEKQIREIRVDLPPGYYRQLPKLAGGPFAGYPRVFGVAWAFVAHTDSLFDPEIAAPLPARLSGGAAADHRRTVGGRDHPAHRARREPAGGSPSVSSTAGPARGSADVVADRLLGAGGRDAEPAEAVLRGCMRRRRCRRLLVQLVHRLRDQDPALRRRWRGSTSNWRRQGTTADAVVRDEHQRQVAASVTVRNIITSMRLISDVDWTELFERVSLVDDVFKAGSDFERHGFPDAQSLSQRHRTPRARLVNCTELDDRARAVDDGSARSRRRDAATTAGAIPATI